MTEADYQYLLHTLSDARSRATAIAVALRSRTGGNHRLTQLGNSAITQIENLLREVRRVAAAQSQTSRSAEPQAAGPPVSKSAAAQAGNLGSAPGAAALAAGLDSEHWFARFVDDLAGLSRDSLTLETVERSLQQRKQAFLKDLETTRRMYRAYPHLFQESREAAAAASPAPQNSAVLLSLRNFVGRAGK